MKIIVALLVLAVVALSVARSPPSVYPDSRPDCKPGTHSYTSACKPKMPEATCSQPNPVMEDQNLCNYIECYCDAPTVRDESTGKCVNLDECPKKENVP